MKWRNSPRNSQKTAMQALIAKCRSLRNTLAQHLDALSWYPVVPVSVIFGPSIRLMTRIEEAATVEAMERNGASYVPLCCNGIPCAASESSVVDESPAWTLTTSSPNPKAQTT